MSVPQDQISLDAAETYLEEAQLLTNFAASSWMVAEMQAAIDQPHLPRVAGAILIARLGLLSEMRQQDMEQVAALKVIEPEIVMGALSRYLHQQPEAQLKSFVESRAREITQPLPTKIYSGGGLRTNAEGRLHERIMAGSWITQKLLIAPPLIKAA